MAREALVAGGTGALGRAVCRELLDNGWRVTATWVARGEAEAIEPEAGLELVEADLLDPGAARIGTPDAVVNLVGGFAMGGRVGEAALEDFEAMLRLNLVPAYNLAAANVPAMAQRGGGAFVCVSARAALEPFAGAAGYITAKAGVLAFIGALDAEYRDAGVRANAVLPSVIDTPANRRSMPGSDHSKWVPPEQIARVIRFLCEDDSAPTSGAAVPVYGKA